MDLNVIISLEDRLYCLLEDKLPSVGHRIRNAVGRAIKAEAMKEVKIQVPTGEAPFSEVFNPDEIEIGKKPAVKIIPMPKKPQKQSAAPAKEPEPISASEPETATPAPEPVPAKEPDMVDVRDAIDRARRRFEGEDYETNKTSEGYVKYHRALNIELRKLAGLFGASDNKPGSVPEENRRAFIKAADELIIDEKGNISAPKAPF